MVLRLKSRVFLCKGDLPLYDNMYYFWRVGMGNPDIMKASLRSEQLDVLFTQGCLKLCP